MGWDSLDTGGVILLVASLAALAGFVISFWFTKQVDHAFSRSKIVQVLGQLVGPGFVIGSGITVAIVDWKSLDLSTLKYWEVRQLAWLLFSGIVLLFLEAVSLR